MKEAHQSKCPRCNGCGRVAGSGRTERPWNAFVDVPPHVALEKILGMYRSRECPDCRGSGAAKTAR